MHVNIIIVADLPLNLLRSSSNRSDKIDMRFEKLRFSSAHLIYCTTYNKTITNFFGYNLATIIKCKK